MTTYLIDGSTELPESGDTGWGTTLNAAILSIDSRFTWSGGQATPDAVAASVITGTTLPATLVTSSLTTVGTLSSLTVSGNATVAGLLTGATTFALVNTTATTVNFAGAATALNIGAGSGTTTINNALVVTGNLTVNGTTTTVNSTTLTVDDKNIVLADTASPTDVGADGGGITLKGTTDKTLNWVDSTDAWTSSEHLNLAAGKAFYIGGTGVLSSTTLGSGVTGSSLTSVGTIATGVWNGTVVTGQYGGTGVANTGKTITLGGDLTTSGAFATTLTATATTSVTLPTTGTLATLAGSETLTNKTLTSPSLTTPPLGVASATTINKVALTAPATGSTLTIADGKTFTASNTLTLTGTDSSSVAFGAGGTVAYTGGTLAQFAATTSSQIAGVISDETGSGSLVFATSPTLVTPDLGTPSALTLTNATGLPIATGVSGLGTGVATFLATPSSANLAAAVTGEAGSGALVFDTSPTITSPAITTSLTTGSTTFALVDTTATTVNFAGAATTLSIGAATGTTTINNALTVTGNLTVNGTTTTVNSTTLTVDDKNIVLADTASPTDVGADGGGITLKGTTDKTLNWVDATDAWTSSEDFNLLTGKVYEINGTTVLSSTALGSGVTGSSLTSLGTIATGTWQGTAITGQYGGTGVANTGKTITLGGDLTTSGAFATTLTATATTSVTLPTTGTLSTLAGSETLTNKTLTSPAITTSLTTGSTSFDLINTTATTVNFAKAATTLSIGAVTGTTTVNNVLTLVGSDSKTTAFTTSGGAFAHMNIFPNSVIGSSAITSPYLSIAGGYAQGTAAGAQSIEGGRVDIYGGSAVGSTGSALTYGGDVYIDGGSGTTRPGRMYIGATNTLSLSIGRTGATTTVTGALTATGTTTVTGALTATGTTILGPASIATQATARTLTLTDQGKVIDMTNSTDVALTIPPNSSVAFPVGTQILVIRNGTGKVSFTPGAGVTLRSDSSKQFISTQYSAATLMQRAADEWYLIGNLAAS